jgi:uncharacterized protein
MTRRAGWTLLLAIGVAIAALGMGRLKLDTDPLGMLSHEMPEVRGLRAFHQVFARENELVLLLEGGGDHEGLMAEKAESLSKSLLESGVAGQARWQPQWMEQGGGMAEVLAYLWLNGPPEVVKERVDAFSPEKSKVTMQEALANVATAMEGSDLLMRAHDPLGFLAHPSLVPLIDGAGDDGAGFESPNGRGHLVMIEAPKSIKGYRESGDWLKALRAKVADWKATEGEGVNVHMTGEPVFAAEIGGAMEEDMKGTVGITSLLIGILFWLMQRKLLLAGALAAVLGLVFVTAVGMAGWIFGELSIMAAGFAAILIGLTVDYGVLICQEAKHTGRNRDTLWKSTAGSVTWAAVTTAVVFFALNRSGLPGIAQLGTMVACGILAGAALMLGFYLPLVAKIGATIPSIKSENKAPIPSPRTAGWIAGGLAVASLGVLFWKGLPQVTFDAAMMRPRHSEAMAAFSKVQELFPRMGDHSVRLMVEAPDAATMEERLENAARLMAENTAAESSVLPADWWPNEARQQANREWLSRWVADRERLMMEAEAVGFTAEGMAMGRAVLDAMSGLLAKPTGSAVFPESESAEEIMRMFVVVNPDGSGTVAGVVHPKDGVQVEGKDAAHFQRMNAEGISPASWELLGPAVAPLVRKDITEVFLPMAALMVLMLGWIFRSVREVAACLAMMALSGVILLATMALLGMGWNFLNIAATPLLLGTGIDYGIHVGLALKRNGGDLSAMWKGTGKAVLFCGASTAIGFGSLMFASNEAMASLGAVAVIGILTAMAVGVFLLPSCFQAKLNR